MMSDEISIAIIGGGPAGLMLGRLLQLERQQRQQQRQAYHQRTWNVTIYELDASSEARGGHGGSLDLHVETGQRALRKAQLHSEFLKYIQEGADALTIQDADQSTVRYLDNGNGLRPEIERRDLLKILLDSIEPNTIQWGKKLKSVQASSQRDTGPLQLNFEDGNSAFCDLVVGADGAWSKVRKALVDTTPSYTGVSFWEVNRDRPASGSGNEDATKGKNGTLFALDDRGGVLIAHLNTLSVHGYVGERCEKGQLRPISQIVQGWAPQLVAMASSSTTAKPVLRELYALPVQHQWVRRSRDHWTQNVTIIGDAAHLMSPMAGEGVNLALADAMDLAGVVIQGKQSLAYFEQRYMFRRAQKAAQESHDNLQLFFSGAGAQAAAQYMRHLMSVSNIIYMAYLWTLEAWEDVLWTVGWRKAKVYA